ncbi:translocation protein Sec62-domain-containing protein [Sphaerosporella brunnea]|uniref:Translocation protein SEC62 n=1 Tax=Sphaerosporella brunnea TaxID=1250544 RepID=A0A5J5F1R3_9PEZI|nr:translocation protein Sec62-domain-containing protein [Sphaerosporella brunnea]
MSVVSAPPPPSPQALAVADYLKSLPQNEFKLRTVILHGQRKEMFKVKRAMRSLMSERYAKASAKNPNLPKITTPETAVAAFLLLPQHHLALRCSQVPEEGPKNPKRVKGQWNVRIEQQQRIEPQEYYVFLYEPRTWTQTLTAAALVIGLFGIVLFPLWPPMLRLGVWYLSMGMLGLIGLFMVMSVFRLILFLVTCVIVSPGLWLYPNLFEDVGFFDSFRPLWAWHKPKGVKSKKKGKAVETPNVSVSEKTAPAVSVSTPPKPTVEEGDD